MDEIPGPGLPAANGLRGAFLAGTRWPGDWSHGLYTHPDGAQIQSPDLGNGSSPMGGYVELRNTFNPESGSTFSPNRQISSAAIFGSLPVATVPAGPEPWHTLLFCANPAAGKYHPGWIEPRDHLLLDLFHMPVVEPYAISEPLATAGKVNLNCQIVPFTYIHRDTALRGAFRSTKIYASPEPLKGDSVRGSQACRFNIDADETLK